MRAGAGDRGVLQGRARQRALPEHDIGVGRENAIVERAHDDIAVERRLDRLVGHRDELADRFVIRRLDDLRGAVLGDKSDDVAFGDDVQRGLHAALAERRDDRTDFIQLERDAQIVGLPAQNVLDVIVGCEIGREELPDQFVLVIGQIQNLIDHAMLHIGFGRNGKRGGHDAESSDSREKGTLGVHVGYSLYPIENPLYAGLPAYLGNRIIAGFIKRSRAVRRPPC